MSIFFYYASFPNSRNKNRSATVNGVTNLIAVANQDATLTLVSPANLNRTYLILTNTSDTLNLRYLYASLTLVDPSAVATFGVKDQLLYDDGGNILYQKQDSGTNTHWVIVQPEDVAEFILPFQNATLDVLGDVYAFAEGTGAGLTVAYDEGRG